MPWVFSRGSWEPSSATHWWLRARPPCLRGPGPRQAQSPYRWQVLGSGRVPWGQASRSAFRHLRELLTPEEADLSRCRRERTARWAPRLGGQGSESLGMSQRTCMCSEGSLSSIWGSPGGGLPAGRPTRVLQEPSGLRPGCSVKRRVYDLRVLQPTNLFLQQWRRSRGGGRPGRRTHPCRGQGASSAAFRLQNNIQEGVLAQCCLSLFYDLERNSQGHLINHHSSCSAVHTPRAGPFLTASFTTSVPSASVRGKDT